MSVRKQFQLIKINVIPSQGELQPLESQSWAFWDSCGEVLRANIQWVGGLLRAWEKGGSRGSWGVVGGEKGWKWTSTTSDKYVGSCATFFVATYLAVIIRITKNKYTEIYKQGWEVTMCYNNKIRVEC